MRRSIRVFVVGLVILAASLGDVAAADPLDGGIPGVDYTVLPIELVNTANSADVVYCEMRVYQASLRNTSTGHIMSGDAWTSCEAPINAIFMFVQLRWRQYPVSEWVLVAEGTDQTVNYEFAWAVAEARCAQWPVSGQWQVQGKVTAVYGSSTYQSPFVNSPIVNSSCPLP